MCQSSGRVIVKLWVIGADYTGCDIGSRGIAGFGHRKSPLTRAGFSGLVIIGSELQRKELITGLVVNPHKRNQNLKDWKWKEQVLKKVLKETLLKMDKTSKMIFILAPLIR